MFRRLVNSTTITKTIGIRRLSNDSNNNNNNNNNKIMEELKEINRSLNFNSLLLNLLMFLK